MKIYGIDVSKHQGAIGWPALAAALKKVNGGQNAGFAILRAGYGNSAGQADKQFEANYRGAKAAGVPVGAFWYSYASGPEDAQREARACLQVIRNKRFEYPVWYDIEYEPVLLAQSKAGRTACCKAFCGELEKAGYYTGIYCSRDYITERLDHAALASYDLWVAAYTGGDGPGAVPMAYGIWQYSSANALGLPGFGKSLDCDIAYKDYPTVIRKAGLNGWGRQEDEEGPRPDAEGPGQAGCDGSAALATLKIGPLSAGDLDAVSKAVAPVVAARKLDNLVKVE